MNETCGCGTNVAVICAGRGPHVGELRCRNCDAHWQWLSRLDYETARAFITEVNNLWGAPVEIKFTTIKQKAEAMKITGKEYDNSNTGALFKNNEKENDNHPDYRGSINVAGAEFWISGWLKTSKKGTRFMSLAIKPKEDDKPAAKTEPEFDDEIPF
jgi:uncharacterized protein (DUF736 family)